MLALGEKKVKQAWYVSFSKAWMAGWLVSVCPDAIDIASLDAQACVPRKLTYQGLIWSDHVADGTRQLGHLVQGLPSCH